MKPFRVLSIDWDYLVNATAYQRATLFPDGGSENIPVGLQNVIWATRYADKKDLENIDIDYQSLDLIKKFIISHCSNAFTTVWDSHKNCFDEVLSSTSINQPIEIINIDFHHDMYVNDFLNEIDCGNWVNGLFEKDAYRLNQKSDKYYWIHREDSQIDKIIENSPYTTELTIDKLENIEEFECDLLFICRSSVWSPPHLDDEFIKFYKWIQNNVTNVEVNITGSRYTEEFKKTVLQHREVMENLKNSLK